MKEPPTNKSRNHPHTKKAEFLVLRGDYLEEIPNFFRQPLSNLRQIGVPALN